MEMLLLGKYLLTPDNVFNKNWGLAVKDGVITDVDENKLLRKKYSNYRLFDFRDKIISPGFINTHLHSYSMLARCKPVPGNIENFNSFLNDYWWPEVEDRIDLEMIKNATRASAFELINSGVTTFCDVLEAPKSIPGALEAQALALEDVGIRAVLSIEGSERLGAAHGQRLIEENMNFFSSVSNHPLLSGMMCSHTTFTCSKEYLRRVSESARKIGAPLQLHINESIYEPKACQERYGVLPVELYDDLNFWDGDVLAAQAVKMEEREIDILQRNNVAISHVPLSNCGFGCGISPVPEMLEKGMLISLGSDGYINNFFEVMRGTYLLHKGRLENSAVMSGQEVFNMATKNGAAALNQPGTGRLQKGSPADIITIDAEFQTPFVDGNGFDQIVLYSNPEDVKNVFINGVIVKESGQLKNSNWSESLEEAGRSAGKLWGIEE